MIDGNMSGNIELYRFVKEYQHIEIRVRAQGTGSAKYVLVHPPYMLQRTSLIDDPEQFRRLKERHRARLLNVRAARESADETTKEFLERTLYDDAGEEKLLAAGRATASDIRDLLQTAVDQGLIPPGAGSAGPTALTMRAWLKRYGIGVDCSAFVQQALTRLLEAGEIGVGLVPEADMQAKMPFLRCRWAYEEITAGGTGRRQLFETVSFPALARAGDILTNRSHMRILVNVELAPEGVTFDLAESISAVDIPSGSTREEADIGPRIVQVRYAQPCKPIREQSPCWKRHRDAAFTAGEREDTYVIGRCRQLVHECRVNERFATE